jgi:hypothetical protein
MKLPWDRDKDNRRNGPPRDPLAGQSDDLNLGDLEPGDAISFWGEGHRIVKSVFECSEGIGERAYTWRWIFLDDGSLIEHSDDGQWRYTEHQIVPQGSALFSDLVGPGGMLEQFEARVRVDRVADDPVWTELRGHRYRVTSTGTVAPKRRGDQPQLGPWTKFVRQADNNIYFALVQAEDEEAGVLGLWTSHVCLSFGRPIGLTDIDAIYRRR